MVLLWGFWTFYAIYCAWKLRRGRWVSLLDCRPTVDIRTGEDVYSCAVDHWLPDPVWRVVNP
jgi:hypothetical protein